MPTWSVWARIATATMATANASAMTIPGKIFALALRPSPNAVRTLCTYRAAVACRRPSRGPL